MNIWVFLTFFAACGAAAASGVGVVPSATHTPARMPTSPHRLNPPAQHPCSPTVFQPGAQVPQIEMPEWEKKIDNFK